MRQLLLFFLCFLFLNGFSREKKIIVAGLVTDCKTKTGIDSIPVKLIRGDGKSMVVYTDKKGRYQFKITSQRLPLACIIIANWRENSSGNGGYGRERKNVIIADSLGIKYQRDFCLLNWENAETREFPIFYFSINTSSSLIPSNVDPFEELTEILLDNPSFVIKIDGHSSSGEIDGKRLSWQRAAFIRKQLLAKGIETGRLVIAGRADSIPAKKTTGEQFGYDENPEARQRVTISVYRKDFLSITQRHHIITGMVTDCKFKETIPECVVKLIGSDGSSIETKTDASGSYLFDSSQVNTWTQYVVVTQAGNNIKTTAAPRGFLNSSDKVKLNITLDSPLKTIVDFCLAPLTICTMAPPTNYFRKNSCTEYYFEDTLNDPEDEILFTYQLMSDNPNLVFEVASHASIDETDPQTLSQKRGEFIKSILVKKGIDPRRLIVKAYGASRPADTSWMYPTDKEKNSKGSKEFVAVKSRRVDFYVLRKDFHPSNQIMIPAKPVAEDELEGE
ncbi:MAG: OmpA family protein [Bacteroidia bacterium]